ncbi:unnamed protein product [Musa textilis]
MQTMNVDKLMKMSGAVRTGGKGNMRRKKKAVHKTTTDDKRLQSTLKRIGVNTIPTIEEVNIFKDDLVIQFVNLKGKCMLYALKKSEILLNGLLVSPLLSLSTSFNCSRWVVSG